MLQKHTYVIFSALYPPHIGGFESYASGLAHALKLMGMRVIVITLRTSSKLPERERQADGVEVFRLPNHTMEGYDRPQPLHDTTYSALMRKVKSIKPDRVIAIGISSTLTVDALSFAKEQNIPAIVIGYETTHHALPVGVVNRFFERKEHATMTKIASFGYPFYAVSQSAFDWLSHFNVQGAGVIPKGFDMDTFARHASARDFRNELWLSDSAYVVAFVGKLEERKGVSALLAAAQSPELSHMTFLFAGKGPMLSRVQKAGANVHALGYLSPNDVAALLSTADVYCLPSHSEGFAPTLLEAAAMGTPIIATDVGGAREVGVGTIGGFMLRDSSKEAIIEALIWAYKHRGLFEQSGAALQQHAWNHLTWDNSAMLLLQAFGDDEPVTEPTFEESADDAPTHDEQPEEPAAEHPDNDREPAPAEPEDDEPAGEEEARAEHMDEGPAFGEPAVEESAHEETEEEPTENASVNADDDAVDVRKEPAEETIASEHAETDEENEPAACDDDDLDFDISLPPKANQVDELEDASPNEADLGTDEDQYEREAEAAVEERIRHSKHAAKGN